jgi:hypothetical protein
MIGFFSILMAKGWCQTRPPSEPGEVLKHSKDIMEYYEIQRNLSEYQKRLNQEADRTEEKPDNQDVMEMDEEDNHVIRYFDTNEWENEK